MIMKEYKDNYSDPKFKLGQPDKKQLAKINLYRPNGAEEYKENEIITVALRASDNLLSHSNGVWKESSLKAMAKTLIGKPLILDHEWGGVDETIGFIYDAEVIRGNKPPDNPNAINESVNKDILEYVGYIELIAFAVIQADSPYINEIKFGRFKYCSTGGFIDTNYICPICETEFSDPECPHLIPHPELYYWQLMELDDDDELEFAPYYINGDWKTAVELSIVVAGDLPNAKVL